MNVLITTTVNVPNVLTRWATGLTTDDHIIVAGDQKSPHDQIIKLLVAIEDKFDVPFMYLHPNDQRKWDVSEIIGWNCIQRRNIALLKALTLKPDYIVTIDDDNAPTQTNQIAQMILNMEAPGDIDVVQSSNHWYDPGEGCSPKVTHRGFPLSLRHTPREYTYDSRPPINIAVGEMLWTGAPDIDAVERICHDPTVTDVEYDTIVPPGVWAPFNSQATVYRVDVAPLMFMWPGVGRYDDIWASYLARAVMDHLQLSVYYGNPAVHQDRNEHDLMTDLTNELFGMTFNEEVINVLQAIKFPSDAPMTPAQLAWQCFKAIAALDFIPRQTAESFEAWMSDLVRAGIS